MASPALQIVPEETRQQFLQAIDGAEVLSSFTAFVDIDRMSSNDDEMLVAE
jgi:hypothetical protein